MPAKRTAFTGTHLYHPTRQPLVVYTISETAEALEQGYGPNYVPQEYPKYVGGKLVANEEEAARRKPAR